jgi:hypothetical protein
MRAADGWGSERVIVASRWKSRMMGLSGIAFGLAILTRLMD